MEPKESNTNKVRAYLTTLKKGELIPASPIIAKAVGLKPRDVWQAFGYLREEGEVAHPTAEETWLRRSQAMLYLKDKWIYAEPYAKLFMSATEAHYAMLFEGVKDIPLPALNSMFSRKRIETRQRQEAHLWQEGDLRDLTSEERTDIKKRSHRYTPAGEVEQRARVWINSFRTMEIQRLPMPHGRLEWMGIVDYVQGLKDPPNFRTYIRALPVDELARWKMLLVDWMEEVDFHQIGLRRFANPRYLALMLARHSSYLVGSQIIRDEDQFRASLQLPGAALPKGLFERIKLVGQLTDQILSAEESDAFGLSVDVRRQFMHMTATDFHKFETYYFIYLRHDPNMATLPLDNPQLIGSHISRLDQDLPTMVSVRNWGRVFSQIMGQVRGT